MDQIWPCTIQTVLSWKSFQYTFTLCWADCRLDIICCLLVFLFLPVGNPYWQKQTINAAETPACDRNPSHLPELPQQHLCVHSTNLKTLRKSKTGTATCTSGFDLISMLIHSQHREWLSLLHWGGHFLLHSWLKQELLTWVRVFRVRQSKWRNYGISTRHGPKVLV